MRNQAFSALLLILFTMISTAAVAAVNGASKLNVEAETADFMQQNADPDPFLRVAAFCPKSGEQRAGQNKICYYRCLSGTVAITISAISLCPLSINR